MKKLLTPSKQAEEWGFPQSTLFIIYTLTIYIFIYISLPFSLSNSVSLAPYTLFLESQRKSLRSTGRGLASLDPQYFSYHLYRYHSFPLLALAATLPPCGHATLPPFSLGVPPFSSAPPCGHATLPLFSSARSCGHATLPPFSSLKNP